MLTVQVAGWIAFILGAGGFVSVFVGEVWRYHRRATRMSRIAGSQGPSVLLVCALQHPSHLQEGGSSSRVTPGRAPRVDFVSVSGQVRWSKSPRTQAAWRSAERRTISRAWTGITPSKLL